MALPWSPGLSWRGVVMTFIGKTPCRAALLTPRFGSICAVADEVYLHLTGLRWIVIDLSRHLFDLPIYNIHTSLFLREVNRLVSSF
ncbi:hypothetical protein IWX49DRAFT_570848, partial [Phyllosticta citricarpa]